MSERQFSDEEVAEIFKQASEAESQGLPMLAGSKGMTLAMLQDIGREAGMSPEAIANAARALTLSTATTSEKFLGMPIGVGQSVDIGHRLSDAEWERLVGDLRVTFNAQGAVRSEGGLRQWRNGNLRAVVEPTSSGQRVRLQTLNSNSRAMMVLGSVSMAASAAVTAALAVSGGMGNPGAATGIAFMGLMGAGSFALGALQVRGWARRRMSQFNDVLARVSASDKPQIPDDLEARR